MTELLAPVSCNISGIPCDKQHQTSAPRTMSYLDLTIMQFRLSFTSIHPCKQTMAIGLSYCKSQGGGKPLQLAPIRYKIHLEYIEHVDCYWFHSDMMITIQSSGFATSFPYHLPILSHTSNSWIHNNLSQVRADPTKTDWWALHPICHLLAHSKNADTS